MEMTNAMELYLEKVDNENAWEFNTITEGAKLEISHYINLWKNSGKPIFEEAGSEIMGSELEVVPLPININGKLVFKFYTYEIFKDGMEEYKIGGETLPEVELVDISKMRFDDGWEDEIYGSGNCLIYTNIEI